jgi:hypothetical protein
LPRPYGASNDISHRARLDPRLKGGFPDVHLDLHPFGFAIGLKNLGLGLFKASLEDLELVLKIGDAGLVIHGNSLI